MGENENPVLREEAAKRANATPLPGALSDAFLTDSIPVSANILVRRVVASDWPLMQWLDSPIYKMFLEMMKEEAIREAVSFTDEEEWEMMWQFTHTPQQCRDLKAKGREAFRATAVAEIGDSMSKIETAEGVAAISQQVVKSFGTKIEYGNEGSKKK
jgi:hypothetical protein